MARGVGNLLVSHAPARGRLRQPDVRTVELSDGRELGLRRWPGRGTPLVLVHGLLDSSHGWDDLARETDRPIWAFDLPGFGISDQAREAKINSYAEDLAEAIDALEIKRYNLVGHSLGGAVASELAELHGEARVRSLTLLAPAGYGRLPLAEFAALPIVRHLSGQAAPRLLGRQRVIETIYRNFVANRRKVPPRLAQQVAHSAANLVPGAKRAVAALSHAGRHPEALHRRSGFYAGPVTAVWGEKDYLVPVGHSKALKRSLPQADIQHWEGMGHHPQNERPEQLLELIEETAARHGKVPLGERLGLRPAPRHPLPEAVAA